MFDVIYIGKVEIQEIYTSKVQIIKEKLECGGNWYGK